MKQIEDLRFGIASILVVLSIYGLVSTIAFFPHATNTLMISKLALAACLIGVLSWGLITNSKDRKNFDDTLSKSSKEQLIQASNSLELSEGTRGLIIEFLNEHHKGWSFSLGNNEQIN